jgi:ubiquinone/menaquinone biosynthesis C-methylase UbiE
MFDYKHTISNLEDKGMDSSSVDRSLQEMYDEYYHHEDTQLLRKREITASQTLEHVKQVFDFDGHKIGKLLDVGAGEGSFLSELDKHELASELYGVEISDSGVETIRSKKIDTLRDIQKFDGYRIPHQDKFFDLAVSIHVLEHVEHERLFLNELKRVANKIIIEVPLEHTLTIEKSIRVSRPHGHINFYTVDTFRNLLETSGLNCLKMQIFPNSKELECFCDGEVKGSLKNFVRATALSISPQIATKVMSYMCTAYCEVN